MYAGVCLYVSSCHDYGLGIKQLMALQARQSKLLNIKSCLGISRVPLQSTERLHFARTFILPCHSRACYLATAEGMGAQMGLCWLCPCLDCILGEVKHAPSRCISSFCNKTTDRQVRKVSLCSLLPCSPQSTSLVDEDWRFGCRVHPACNFSAASWIPWQRYPCSRHLLLLLIPAQVHQAEQRGKGSYS